jgi:predicted TIM-barrel fold metal-dependent hydrolase
VLTHGFYWRFFLTDHGLELPAELFEPFQASSAKLELLLPIALGDVWEYPFVELQPTIVQLVERLGADRLIWGIDMPNVERYCNYRQTLDAYRVHLQGVLSEADIAQLLGGAIADVFQT